MANNPTFSDKRSDKPAVPGYNTYIGARYVPIFDGAWVKSKTYEPLMIVEWQGNSYTSRTYVPANVEITDETYWALTGNYNAQIEAYREEVENVRKDIVASNVNMNNLNNMRLSVKNRKFIFIGDSYSFGYNPDVEYQRGWVTRSASLLGLVENVSYWHMPAGLRAGGYGLASDDTDDHTSFSTAFSLWDISSIPSDSITDVVIIAGTNDTKYAGNINRGMMSLTSKLKSAFPNANIALGCLAVSDNIIRFSSDIRRVYNAYSETACNAGVHFMKNIIWSLHDVAYVSSDGVHPSEQGYLHSSGYIAQAISTGDCNVIRTTLTSMTNLATSFVTMPEGQSIRITLNNETVECEIYGITSGLIGSILSLSITANAQQSAAYNLKTCPSFIFTPLSPSYDNNYVQTIAGSGIASGNVERFSLCFRDRAIGLSYRVVTSGQIGNILYVPTGKTMLSAWNC